MNGVELIRYERDRQVSKGWTRAHDERAHLDGQLVKAAFVYALYSGKGTSLDKALSELMPWSMPNDEPAAPDSMNGYLTAIARMSPMEKLAKAGALIAAEIDRLGGRAE